MQHLKQYLPAQAGWREAILIGLFFANVCVWSVVWQRRANDILRVYFFAVGKGDAIFIDSPTDGRILIDGGPDEEILSDLGGVLPFGDKRIDMIIESNPGANHISGLIGVVKFYKVGGFIDSDIPSKNYVHVMLADEVKSEKIPAVVAKPGMTIDLGGEAKLVLLLQKQKFAELTYGKNDLILNATSTATTTVRRLTD